MIETHLGDPGINTLLRRLGELPAPEDLEYNTDSDQPRTAGVIVFDIGLSDLLCACTRNLRRMDNRLRAAGAEVLCSLPVFERDSQARRLWRFMLGHMKPLAVLGYTFYFRKDRQNLALARELAEAWTIQPGASREALKSLVLGAIREVSRSGRCTVSEVVSLTLRHVDGLEIDNFLGWLAQDGLITYRPMRNIFDGIINLL
jgi:hypothetical protein